MRMSRIFNSNFFAIREGVLLWFSLVVEFRMSWVVNTDPFAVRKSVFLGQFEIVKRMSFVINVHLITVG